MPSPRLPHSGKDLSDSGIPNTVDPAPGYGYTLDAKGRIPLATESGRWTLEYVAVTTDLGNLAAHSGTAATMTVPGLQVNDLCFFIGVDSEANVGQFIYYTYPPVCSTAGQISLRRFNADAAAHDPGSVAYHFLVLHRFIP